MYCDCFIDIYWDDSVDPPIRRLNPFDEKFEKNKKMKITAKCNDSSNDKRSVCRTVIVFDKKKKYINNSIEIYAAITNCSITLRDRISSVPIHIRLRFLFYTINT